MNLTWFQSLLYGLVAGIMDILPVSAQAHERILLTMCGETGAHALLRLLTHLAVLGALYYGCQGQIRRMTRAAKLAKVPKRRRKRPLDRASLMDISLLKTALVPVVIAMLFYGKTSSLSSNLILMSVLLLVNGVILYIPQYLAGSNKDAASMSRRDGLLMGLGSALSVLPGLSGVGVSASVGKVCGADSGYALNIALLLNIPVNIGFILFDLISLVTGGLSGLSFYAVVIYILSALLSFLGATLGIRIIRKLFVNNGFGLFAFYSLGMALFTFIFHITV